MHVEAQNTLCSVSVCLCADMIDRLTLYCHVLYAMCMLQFQARPLVDLWERTHFQLDAVYEFKVVCRRGVGSPPPLSMR